MAFVVLIVFIDIGWVSGLVVKWIFECMFEIGELVEVVVVVEGFI